MARQSLLPAPSCLAGALPRLPDPRASASHGRGDDLATSFPASAEPLRVWPGEMSRLQRRLAHERTQRERLQQELRSARAEAAAASLAKSQFLAAVSHELRTPLNIMLGYAELLAENAVERGESDQARDLETILTAGRHLLELINDLLDLSQAEAGMIDPALESVALGELVQDAATTLRPLAERNGNTLIVRTEEGLRRIHTDPIRLHQILRHLLANAGKFTERGAIVVEVEREGSEWVCFHVSDTGIGMAPEQLEALFAPFTQADASATRRHGGLGMGLALTRCLARLLGGRVSAESAPNAGTTVTVRLPVHGPAPREPPLEPEHSRRWLSSRPRRRAEPPAIDGRSRAQGTC